MLPKTNLKMMHPKFQMIFCFYHQILRTKMALSVRQTQMQTWSEYSRIEASFEIWSTDKINFGLLMSKVRPFIANPHIQNWLSDLVILNRRFFKRYSMIEKVPHRPYTLPFTFGPIYGAPVWWGGCKVLRALGNFQE